MKELKSDGSVEKTALAEPETRAVAGEELWCPPVGHAGVTVTEHTALRLSAVLATVNVVATDTAVLPLDVKQKLEDGSRREATELRIYELLKRSPDGETTPLKWRQALMAHALEFGNGYAEVQRTGRGEPYALHLLDPRRTRARRDNGRLGYDTGAGWLPAANVLHVAGIGFDGLSGYNVVRLLAEAIGVGLGAQSYAADWFANGSEAGGVIETPKKLGPDGRKNLAAGWEMRHGGPGNRHRVAVLEEGANYKATSVDPEKSQLVETRKFQVIDVIRPWRVPPHKVGDMSQAHLNNIEASNLDYLMTTLMGWLECIEQEFMLKLLTRSQWLNGFYIEHNVNALLRGDLKARGEFYRQMVGLSVMTPGDVAARENFDPLGKHGRQRYVSVNFQTVENAAAGKGKTPAPAPTKPGDAGDEPDADDGQAVDKDQTDNEGDHDGGA